MRSYVTFGKIAKYFLNMIKNISWRLSLFYKIIQNSIKLSDIFRISSCNRKEALDMICVTKILPNSPSVLLLTCWERRSWLCVVPWLWVLLGCRTNNDWPSSVRPFSQSGKTTNTETSLASTHWASQLFTINKGIELTINSNQINWGAKILKLAWNAFDQMSIFIKGETVYFNQRLTGTDRVK